MEYVEVPKDYVFLMWVVCAWCKKAYGLKPCKDPGGHSHGICKACRKEYFPKKKAA